MMFLVLVHEQDPRKGACPFRVFFQQTPEELQKKYRLYDTLAIPLYPTPEHRSISLRYALRNMGATPKQSQVSMWARLVTSSSTTKKPIKLRARFHRRDQLLTQLNVLRAHATEPDPVDEGGHNTNAGIVRFHFGPKSV